VDVQDIPRDECAYSFLDFTLDLGAERLLRGTSDIKLRPKSFQVLRYLVERHGRLVTREELLQTVWGDVAVTDESVTKCIADIRKALGHSQDIIRTVTRRGFIFQAEVRLVYPPQVAAQQHPRRALAGRRAVVLASIATFGVVAGVVSLQWRGNLFGRRPAFEAIAVLPFESLGDSADQQYLADGMTDALITNLGQASTLRVIARTSVSQYRGTKKPIREIARELNVDVVVEGTITQSGDRLRATANLIQVSPEKHIWAGSYERSFRDALALQNEIAGAIAGEIQGKLTPRQQSHSTTSRPVNPDAQFAYWKARYFLRGRREVDAARKSIEYSEQAVRIDPTYAPAQASLAMSYLMLSNLGGGFPSEVMPRAKTAAQRAIALDEELAEAHVALGAILLAYDWDWAGAEREVRRAISLNPSDADAHQGLANYLAAVGRVDEAVAEIRRARELDPFSFYINRNVGRILYFARKYDEAIAELRQAGDMQPNSFSVVDGWIVRSYLKKGLADDAVAVDLRIHAMRDGLDAQSLDALRAAYSEKGLRGYLTKLRELVLPAYRSRVFGSYLLAEIDTFRNDKEEAFRWLERAYQVRSGAMPWIKVDPSFDGLRSDPRFSALLRRMGLTQ
jgi:TolB-like protein/DNA-binding winged helix-turn-helix (wHTH) protein/Tfp pilus assembly protein PilF